MVTVLVASLIALFGAFRAIEELRWGGVALTVVAGAAFVAGVWPRLAAGLEAPAGLIHVGNPVMWIVLVLACVGAVLALYVLSKVVHPSRTGWIALVAAASLLAIPVLATGMRFGEGGGSGYYSDGWEDHPNVRRVAFKETPNLYFVGFDSITPEAIMRKHMGIETTRYHRLMERQMRRFPNLFANAVPTWFSFNTLMALDQDIYLEYRDLDYRPPFPAPSYFAGHDLSPLIWLLKLNGYETTSIYQNSYFGRAQGPNIDNYVVNNTRSALCSLLDEDIRVLAFWGYCWSWASRLRDAGPAGDFLVQQLSGVDKTKPQFVAAHLNLPGHAPTMFDYRNEADRDRFQAAFERKFNAAATYLEQIIEHLRANDPDAILFVFGDHGALLSQGMDVEDDPTFFLQDRFGILGGVYPRDQCAPRVRRGRAQGLHDVSGRGACDNRVPIGRAEPYP